MADGKKVVLLTGAAGGIGAAVARVFARAGYRLALTDIDAASLAVCTESCGSSGGFALAGDLSDLDFAQSLVERSVEALGGIDVLVNVAAWRELAPMSRVSVAGWEKTLRVCLTVPAFLSRWAAQSMMRRGGGVIINLGSIAAVQTRGYAPAYSAAKGGLESLTYDLASLYGSRGVRVVTLRLGAIDTAMSAKIGRSSALDDKIRTHSEQMIPLHRWATAEEAAQTILWLASDHASYVHGTCVTMDGGWTHNQLPHELNREQFPKDYA